MSKKVCFDSTKTNICKLNHKTAMREVLVIISGNHMHGSGDMYFCTAWSISISSEQNYERNKVTEKTKRQPTIAH